MSDDVCNETGSASNSDAEAECMKTGHGWHKPVEGVVECRFCGMDSNEFILGLRADEALTPGVDPE